MQNDTIAGAICANEAGLTLSQRGSLNDTVSAAARDLIVLAKTLEPASTEAPVVSLISGESKVVISREGAVTVALHKKE